MAEAEVDVRHILLIAIAGVLAVGCSSTPTLSEYAEDVESLATAMNTELDALDAQYGEISDISLARTYAADRLAARRAFTEGLAGLTPPEPVAALHEEALDLITEVVATEAAVATRLDTLDTLEGVGDLWDSPEGSAARAADQRLILLCEAAQDTFDRTAAGAEYEGVPWIPAEMKEVVRVTFGCRAEDR